MTFFLVLWFALAWAYLGWNVGTVVEIQPPTRIFVHMISSFILVQSYPTNSSAVQQPRSYAASATSIISSFSPVGPEKNV